MKGLILLLLISLPVYAGFDGANAPGGEGVQGAPGGYNYIGKGLQVGKPASSSKAVDSTKSGTQSGTKGKKGNCGK